MERIRCKEIVLNCYAVGTMNIMDYADEHPNEYFDFTEVRSKYTNFGRLMVSEYCPTNDMIEYFDKVGWRDLPNGWQRTIVGFAFYCRKNERYIFITR